MSDHHQGAAVRTDLAQCALNGRFTVGIGLRSRLVQDDDRWVLKDGAGDRQALLLSPPDSSPPEPPPISVSYPSGSRMITS